MQPPRARTAAKRGKRCAKEGMNRFSAITCLVRSGCRASPNICSLASLIPERTSHVNLTGDLHHFLPRNCLRRANTRALRWRIHPPGKSWEFSVNSRHRLAQSPRTFLHPQHRVPIAAYRTKPPRNNFAWENVYCERVRRCRSGRSALSACKRKRLMNQIHQQLRPRPRPFLLKPS